MNAASSQFRPWVCYALTISSISWLAGPVCGEDEGAQGKKQDAKAAVKMVDALANRNRAPKLVGDPFGHGTRIPLFADNYDWNEQERVSLALGELCKDTSPELWEELIRKAGDPRYSLTVMDEAENATDHSVGAFCRELAYSRLVGVFEQHLPPSDETAKYNRLYLEIGFGPEGVAEWRKRRMNQPLYQLQIEVCERAAAALPRARGIAQRQKDSTRKKIEAEIERLKRRKQPVFVGIGLSEINTYSAEDANYLRQKAEGKK